MDNLKTEIITPTGARVKPYVKITGGDSGSNVYTLFVPKDNGEMIEIGSMSFDLKEHYIQIGKMNNWTSKAPLSQRYSKVGLALHEIAFRESRRYGKNGRVVLFSSNLEADLFHWSCGFIPCTLENKGTVIKIDEDKKSKIESVIAQAKEARQKGLSAPFYSITTISPDYMFLPPESIERLEVIYYSSSPTHSPTPTDSVQPTFSIEKLVSTGMLSRINAIDLTSKLLKPPHPGDKETWELVLSSRCLHGMQKEYFNGFVIGTYFRQTDSPKLRLMVSPWGLYAFSRFLIGWQDCEASHVETLRFVLSDYGLKALEEGLIKPEHFRGKLPAYEAFTERLYCQLKGKETEPDALFSLHPIAKPQNTVRIALV